MKKTTLIILILIAVGALYYIGGIPARQNVERLQTALTQANMDKFMLVTKYQVEIQKTKQQVYETQQIVLTKDEAIKAGYIEKERYKQMYLKSIASVSALKLQVSILQDSLEHSGEVIYVVSDNASVPALTLPFTFDNNKSETFKYYSLQGTFDTEGKGTYSLKIPEIPISLTIGEQRKTKQPIVNAMTDFPYISDITISSVSVVKKDHFYNKTMFKFGCGAFTGALLVYLLK